MNWLFQTFNLITLEHIALNKYLQLKRGKNVLTFAKKNLHSEYNKLCLQIIENYCVSFIDNKINYF